MKKPCMILGTIFFVTFACYGQQRSRSINWNPLIVQGVSVKGDNGRLVPTELNALEMIEIIVDQKPIALGREFPASGDWLKGLSVKVRNISGKSIASIRMTFSLPETKSEKGTRGFTLEYGKALSTGIDYGVQKALAAGDELILMRNDKHYERDRQWLIRTNGTSDFAELFIDGAVVQFEDGTVWFSQGPVLVRTANK